MLMLHRMRELLERQRTMLANAVRAHLSELGIVAPQGISVKKLATQVHDPAVPLMTREALMLIRAPLGCHSDYGLMCRLRAKYIM
jgi:transposase